MPQQCWEHYRGGCKDTSYQIQHTVCNFDYITSGREIKGNLRQKAGDFLILAIEYTRASTDHQEYSVGTNQNITMTGQSATNTKS